VSTLLKSALELWRSGFSVIPIQSGSKRPLVPWTEYQSRRPTKEEIRQWWQQYPNANIGIVTGKISGIVVIDLDLDKDKDDNESGAKIYEQAPTDLIVKTGRGGYHLYYRYPEDVDHVPNRVGLLPGVDIRADGGYVVAPPSAHSSGRLYEWTRRGKPGNLPPHLVGLLTSHTPVERDDEEGSSKWLSDLLAGAGKGQRNDACARLCGYLFGKGMPKDVVLTIIRQWNEKNRPPLPDYEVVTTVESVYKTAHRRGIVPQGQPQDGGTGQASTSPFSVVSIQEYMVRHGSGQVSWLVQDWLPEATIGFVVAPPGSFKTWLTFDMAVSVATGTSFLGKYPVQRTGPILLIQQEDFHGDIAQRLAVIIQSRLDLRAEATEDDQFEVKVPPEVPIYIHPDRNLRFADQVVMDALELRIRELHPALVILDPLYSAAMTDDYMTKSAEQMLRLKVMRDRYGCSFLVAHHTTKHADNMERSRLWGSQFLNALLETGWQVKRSENDSSIIVRRHFKVAKAPAEDIRVEFDVNTDNLPYRYHTKILTGAEVVESGTGLNSKILDLLGESEKPMSINEIADAFGVHRSTISRRMKALEKDSMVQKDANRRYSVFQSDLPSF
jgi:DNA-binding transcriptional ArsR family regulator